MKNAFIQETLARKERNKIFDEKIKDKGSHKREKRFVKSRGKNSKV
jgi:hypothetical protein